MNIELVWGQDSSLRHVKIGAPYIFAFKFMLPYYEAADQDLIHLLMVASEDLERVETL